MPRLKGIAISSLTMTRCHRATFLESRIPLLVIPDMSGHAPWEQENSDIKRGVIKYVSRFVHFQYTCTVAK